MEFLARHKRLKWTSLAVVLFLLLWMLWPDSRLEQVRAMQKELFSKDSKKLSSEERKDKFQALRKATDSLSPAQKLVLAKGGQERFQKEMERYAKMSKKEQTAYLDKQIDNMSKGKKGPAGGAPGGGGDFGKKGGQSMSSADRDRMRRQRLDQSTPEFRALMDRYRKDLQARMTARGVQIGKRPV